MKYEKIESPSRGAKRVLDAFCAAFEKLLPEKSFETITVNELCTVAGYPRATFYNYFDDKYDLLHYLWQRLSQYADFESLSLKPPSELPLLFFNRVADLLEEHEKAVRSILHNNAPDGYLCVSCKTYLGKMLEKLFGMMPQTSSMPVPRDLLVEHYRNTLWLVFEWRYTRDSEITRETVKRYLQSLLP